MTTSAKLWYIIPPPNSLESDSYVKFDVRWLMVNRIDTIDGKLKLDFHHFAREHMELLDAVEQYGYGNWGDIAKKVSCSRAGGGRAVGGAGQNGQSGGHRAPEEAREEFGEAFVAGSIGASTWREDDRGRARDHTQGNPLLPEPAPAPGPADVQAAMPGLGLHETTMLGYMPLR